MAFEWKLALESLKVSSRYVVAVALAASAVLFLPTTFIETIGLKDFRQQSQPYLGGVFLLCSCILIVQAGMALWKWSKEHYSQHRSLRSAQAKMRVLTPEEKELLREYLQAKTKSRYLPMASGVVAGLIHADIIYRAANIGRAGSGDFKFAHNIQPWAWEYLNKHPEILAPEQPGHEE